MIEIIPINFEKIEPIWRANLWPERKSIIEPVSWINCRGEIDTTLKPGQPFFWGVFANNKKLIGVCSGFKTSEIRYRSRGLWVHPDFRGFGIGQKLINKIVFSAREEGCHFLWTMPRLNSWGFYLKSGFIKTNTTKEYDYGPHILAEKPINKNSNLFINSDGNRQTLSVAKANEVV